MAPMGSIPLGILGLQKFILNFRVRNSTETKKVSFKIGLVAALVVNLVDDLPRNTPTVALPIVLRRSHETMPANFEFGDFDPVLMMIVGLAGIAIVVALEDEFDEGPRFDQNAAITAMHDILQRATATYHLYKRGRMDDNGLPIPKRRRSVTNFNWERARAAIFEDYMSPMPKFNDRFFERHFRVSRSIVEELRLICAAADPFFQDRMHAAKRTLGICPDAKILFPLQMLANGTSPSAHQSYYQMGETTAREALKKLCRIIRQSDDLRERFLRSMSRSDAQHASELHLDTHGIEGMVGSLDCMHVGWKNCPVAWQGAYTSGKEGHPTLVLEAMADHNLFVWHASFGWAGTLNDINIWEGSALHKGFLDGTWSERVDFPFTINGQDFTKLFVLVDGIYPELARFAKPLAEPVGAHQHAYSSWQESS
jgi:Plant transposon protein